MVGFLQNLVQRLLKSPGERRTPAEPGPPPPSQPPPAAPSANVRSPHPEGFTTNGEGIELPLQPILDGLPLELQPRVVQPDARDQIISVPLAAILKQLSSGAVKIPFSHLRQSAPGLFTRNADRDQVMVSIPLAEVLPRINPAFIMRRREQRLVAVPSDIRSPFDQHGQEQPFSLGQARSDAAPAPPFNQARQMSYPPVSTPSRNGAISEPLPATPTPSPRYNPAVNPTPPQVASPQAAGTTTFVVSLLSLAEGWPEAVRKEIVQTNLIDAKLTLPPDAIDRALKQGRIAFTWQTLRSWIKPVPMNATSAHGDLVLELPLKIVAPLFLARQQELHKEHKKVAIDEEIPNLFFGAPENTANPLRVEPSSKASDTSHILRTAVPGRDRLQETDGNTRPAPRVGSAPGRATPNELVARASAIDGVAGSLIALPDGLMVASKLSPGLNGDTLAAFLPQIFAKVNQCTKELCMGELNDLHFTMDNVPWQIFRVQSVFFAAFGREGKTLPTAELAALAADLEHRLS